MAIGVLLAVLWNLLCVYSFRFQYITHTPKANSPPRNDQYGKIYISLTTTSFRFKEVHNIVATLLSGTILPDHIFVVISDEKFLLDEGVDVSTVKSSQVYEMSMRSDIVQIVYSDNIGPHRKLLPVLEQKFNEDCLIITVDDDHMYSPTFLEVMLETYVASGSSSVVAYRARKLSFCHDDITKSLVDSHDHAVTSDRQQIDHFFQEHQLNWQLAPYFGVSGNRNFFSEEYAKGKDPTKKEAVWPIAEPGTKEMLALPTGVGGVLYAPKFFKRNIIFDTKLREITQSGDDIMFRLATMANGVKIVVACDQKFYGLHHVWCRNKSNKNWVKKQQSTADTAGEINSNSNGDSKISGSDTKSSDAKHKSSKPKTATDRQIMEVVAKTDTTSAAHATITATSSSIPTSKEIPFSVHKSSDMLDGSNGGFGFSVHGRNSNLHHAHVSVHLPKHRQQEHQTHRPHSSKNSVLNNEFKDLKSEAQMLKYEFIEKKQLQENKPPVKDNSINQVSRLLIPAPLIEAQQQPRQQYHRQLAPRPASESTSNIGLWNITNSDSSNIKMLMEGLTYLTSAGYMDNFMDKFLHPHLVLERFSCIRHVVSRWFINMQHVVANGTSSVATTGMIAEEQHRQLELQKQHGFSLSASSKHWNTTAVFGVQRRSKQYYTDIASHVSFKNAFHELHSLKNIRHVSPFVLLKLMINVDASLLIECGLLKCNA